MSSVFNEQITSYVEAPLGLGGAQPDGSAVNPTKKEKKEIFCNCKV